MDSNGTEGLEARQAATKEWQQNGSTMEGMKKGGSAMNEWGGLRMMYRK